MAPALFAAVIAIAPIGDAPIEELSGLAAVVRDAFGCEVTIVPEVSLPTSAWNSSRGQHLSTALLDALARAKRPEWERLLGVADVDLYVPRLNFVFGEGDSRRGVAVFSLARLRDADKNLFRKRAATEAVHELGHTYGLSHCENPACVTWFSNTLAETDRKAFRFCPRHAEELARLRAIATGRSDGRPARNPRE